MKQTVQEAVGKVSKDTLQRIGQQVAYRLDKGRTTDIGLGELNTMLYKHTLNFLILIS